MPPIRNVGIMESPKGLLNVIRHIGPGIILSGSVIGSGELLVTTRMGARFGTIFLWGVILCCVIKYFVQVEFGRYCISNNLTSIQAFNRFPFAKIRKTSVLNIFFFAILAMITPGLAGTFGSCAGLLYSLFPTDDRIYFIHDPGVFQSQRCHELWQIILKTYPVRSSLISQSKI